MLEHQSHSISCSAFCAVLLTEYANRTKNIIHWSSDFSLSSAKAVFSLGDTSVVAKATGSKLLMVCLCSFWNSFPRQTKVVHSLGIVQILPTCDVELFGDELLPLQHISFFSSTPQNHGQLQVQQVDCGECPHCEWVLVERHKTPSTADPARSPDELLTSGKPATRRNDRQKKQQKKKGNGEHARSSQVGETHHSSSPIALCEEDPQGHFTSG